MRAGQAFFSVLFAFLLIASSALAGDVAAKITVRPLPNFSIVEPAKVRFGELEYVGGFEIRADRREVGGLSGLVVSEAGREFLSLSDDGFMVRAKIERDGLKRPTGLSSALIRRLQTSRGPLPRNKAFSDSESIDVYTDRAGRRFGVISFERHPALMVGPVDADGFVGPLTAVELPGGVRQLQSNRGLESVAALPLDNNLGRFVILGEEAERRATADNQPGWAIGGKEPIAFRVDRLDGYDLTDAKIGPDGRLYVLERDASLTRGVRCRLRAFRLSDIQPGAVIDGVTLFEANLSEEIDNMEGLSIWRDDNGETRISMISDDNHAFIQRTLYLEFRLVTS